MKRLSLLGILAIGLSSCQARGYSTNNRADILLRFTKIQGQGSGASTGASDFLLSDVLFKGSVIDDSALLSFDIVQKNPLTTEIGVVNDVYLNSYKVEYLRSDGRNVEGVDVPYAITGTMATLVPAGGTGAAAIVIVRHQAKDEPPLKDLRCYQDQETKACTVGPNPGAVVLTTTARITVFGKTTSGKDVSAVGSLEITFSDFGDTTS